MFKMVKLLNLVSQRGISINDLQNQVDLFVTLCIYSDFSVMDHNINNIVNQLTRYRND